MSAGVDTTKFFDAAVRHHRDAELLRSENRLANADHLAGIAGECALKAIMIDYLGGEVNGAGKPAHPDDPSRRFVHFPWLWNEMGMIAQGRAGAEFGQLITGANPFGQWQVAERYSEGTHVTPERVAHHMSASREIIEFYERARHEGVLP